jgi:integrase
VRVVLDGIAEDRNRHGWHLALAGLRRGEIAGQRWADIDLDNRTLTIGSTPRGRRGPCSRPGATQDSVSRSGAANTGCPACRVESRQGAPGR